MTICQRWLLISKLSATVKFAPVAAHPQKMALFDAGKFLFSIY
jgi:hypothetical protein